MASAMLFNGDCSLSLSLSDIARRLRLAALYDKKAKIKGAVSRNSAKLGLLLQNAR